MRLSPAPVRSRTRGARTGTGPRPVMIARSGRWPWRTSRWRPSPVCLSAWPLRKAATSASTACANSARAPSRRTSVSGSENSAGWISLTTLSWIMACHSFGGEVEVPNTPTIRRLIPHAVINFRAYLISGHHHPRDLGASDRRGCPDRTRPVVGRLGLTRLRVDGRDRPDPLPFRGCRRRNGRLLNRACGRCVYPDCDRRDSVRSAGWLGHAAAAPWNARSHGGDDPILAHTLRGVLAARDDGRLRRHRGRFGGPPRELERSRA